MQDCPSAKNICKSEELGELRIGTSQFDDQKEQVEMVWTC